MKQYLGDNYIVLLDTRVFIILVALLLVIGYNYRNVFSTFSKHKVSLKQIVLFALIFNIIVFFVWPIASTDLFSYIYQGRIASLYEANPYLVTYTTFPNDTFYHIISNKWSSITVLYGPLFVLVSKTVTLIAKDNLLVNLYLFKFFFLVIQTLNIFLVYSITKSKRATYLYAWNPSLVFEFVLNGHNDTFLVFFLLLAILFITKAKTLIHFILAHAMIILATLVKFMPVVLIPILFLWSFKNLATKKQKFILTVSVATVALVLYGFSYLYIWGGFQGFVNMSKIVSGLFSLIASPLIVLLYAVLDGFKVHHAISLSQKIGMYTFYCLYVVTVVIALMSKSFTTHRGILKTMIIVMLVMYATAFNWLMPWYLSIHITTLIIYMGYTKNYVYVNFLWMLTAITIIPYLILR